MWKAEDYRDHPERWTHVFSKEEIAELGGAADEFIKKGWKLTAMAKVCPKIEGLGIWLSCSFADLVGLGFVPFAYA